jgi:hypothetical protein
MPSLRQRFDLPSPLQYDAPPAYDILSNLMDIISLVQNQLNI